MEEGMRRYMTDAQDPTSWTTPRETSCVDQDQNTGLWWCLCPPIDKLRFLLLLLLLLKLPPITPASRHDDRRFDGRGWMDPHMTAHSFRMTCQRRASM